MKERLGGGEWLDVGGKERTSDLLFAAPGHWLGPRRQESLPRPAKVILLVGRLLLPWVCSVLYLPCTPPGYVPNTHTKCAETVCPRGLSPCAWAGYAAEPRSLIAAASNQQTCLTAFSSSLASFRPSLAASRLERRPAHPLLTRPRTSPVPCPWTLAQMRSGLFSGPTADWLQRLNN